MISTAYIKEWKQHAPWTRNDQVEQDLIILSITGAFYFFFDHFCAFPNEMLLHKRISQKSRLK